MSRRRVIAESAPLVSAPGQPRSAAFCEMQFVGRFCRLRLTDSRMRDCRATLRAQTGRAAGGPSPRPRHMVGEGAAARHPQRSGQCRSSTANSTSWAGSRAMQEASTLNAGVRSRPPTPGATRRRCRGPLSHPNATVLNGKIYVIGGFLRAGARHRAGFAASEYDPATDTWRTLAPLKTPRGSVAVAALNGKIHAIGGRTPDRVTSAVHEVYDPATNMWTDAAPLPLARDHVGVAAVNGKIHIIGGRTTCRWTTSTATTSTIPPRTVDDRVRRCRRRGAAARRRSSRGQHRHHGRRMQRRASRSTRSRRSTSSPAAGGRSRRCRSGSTESRRPPTARSIYIAGGNPECGLSYSNPTWSRLLCPSSRCRVRLRAGCSST